MHKQEKRLNILMGFGTIGARIVTNFVMFMISAGVDSMDLVKFGNPIKQTMLVEISQSYLNGETRSARHTTPRAYTRRSTRCNEIDHGSCRAELCTFNHDDMLRPRKYVCCTQWAVRLTGAPRAVVGTCSLWSFCCQLCRPVDSYCSRQKKV